MPRGCGIYRLVSAAALFLCTASPAVSADSTSLCIVPDPGCLAPGGIQARVVIGPNDSVILGGQFSLTYDPQALSLIDVAPGRKCDPASPFVFKLLEDDDHSTGTVNCAIGVNFLEDPPTPGTATTLACLSFAATGNVVDPTPLCLTEGQVPFETRLVDDSVHIVPIDNSETCPPPFPPPVLACDNVNPSVNCSCIPASVDCHGLDTPCRTGYCNPLTKRCEVMSVNEDGPCDDEDACTTVDRCRNGICVGEGCENQSICATSSSCLGLDSVLTVKIRLSEGDHVIQGAQFSVQYDPSELDFTSIVPGGFCDANSPFRKQLRDMVDESAGEIFYAVGIGPDGPAGTTEPATLACLTFIHLGQADPDVCLFNDTPPMSTILVDSLGRSVPTGNPHLCVSNREPPEPRCANFEPCKIPTVTEWGLVAMTLLLLTAAKILFGYPRAVSARQSASHSAKPKVR